MNDLGQRRREPAAADDKRFLIAVKQNVYLLFSLRRETEPMQAGP